MAIKRWRLVVSDLGGDSRNEVSVEAEHWMAALTAGRAEFGEPGGVPPGSSCAVAPDGKVTILDPVARRRYSLAPDATRTFAAPRPKGPSVPADSVPRRPSAPPPSRDSGGAKAAAKPPAPAAPRPAPAQPKKKKRTKASRTVAYIDASQLPKTPGSAGAPQAPASPAPEAPSPPPAKPPEATPAAEPAFRLHSSRDAEPTAESPLRYRERTYVIPEGTDVTAADAILHARLEELRAELADQPQGKFVNLAAFDHDWEGRPARPPVATLEWKDWRGAPVLTHPLEQKQAATRKPAPEPPAAAAAPQPVRAASAKSAPRRRQRAGTDEHDARLAKAFEACQDLFFLASPADALDFTTRLLLELVPSEAVSGCLYDINTDEFRFVSVHGPGAEERQGEAVPADVGIMGVAAHAHAGPMRIADTRNDSRYDPGVDGRVGVEILDMCYLPLEHQGRLLGMIQTINRQSESGFTEKDVDLFSYVGKQTSEFLFRARIAPDTKRKS